MLGLRFLYSFAVETRPTTAAVSLQGAVLANRVGPGKDPILPGRQTAEDLGRDSLAAGKAQIRLHSGQCIGGEACTLLERQPDLVLPVELVWGKGHQAETECGGSVQRCPGMPFECCGRCLGIEAGGEPSAAVDHRKVAKIQWRKGDARAIGLHVAAVGGERQL